MGLGHQLNTRWPGIFLSFRDECPAPQGISQSWTNHECGSAPGSPVILPHALHVAREQTVTTHLSLPSALVPLPAASSQCVLPAYRLGPAFTAPSPVSTTLLHRMLTLKVTGASVPLGGCVCEQSYLFLEGGQEEPPLHFKDQV